MSTMRSSRMLHAPQIRRADRRIMPKTSCPFRGQLREVRSVLAGNSGDQRSFGHPGSGDFLETLSGRSFDCMGRSATRSGSATPARCEEVEFVGDERRGSRATGGRPPLQRRAGRARSRARGPRRAARQRSSVRHGGTGASRRRATSVGPHRLRWLEPFFERQHALNGRVAVAIDELIGRERERQASFERFQTALIVFFSRSPPSSKPRIAPSWPGPARGSKSRSSR